VNAVVLQADVSADGAFAFPEVPAPARYQLVVAKQGATTETRDVFVEAAQAVTGIEVFLRGGDGVIEGRIESGGVPLGGVTVGASDGNATTSTVSLTTPDRLGEFSLRGLATPGRYTITATKEGFQLESRTISLAAGQRLPGVVISLTRARGSVSGTVRDSTGQPLGGVAVTVQGGDVSLTTTTVSQGEVGTYLLQGVPAPGNYTVTFTRSGYVPQSRLVVLDPLTNRLDVPGVDADLVNAASTVTGVVRDSRGTLLALATLTLTDGRSTRIVRSASVPLGAFEFANLPAGAYTLTASRKGSTPAVILVSTLPGEVKDLPTQVVLGPRASLNGIVNRQTSSGLVPAPGLTVKLFVATKFPAEALLTTTTDANGRYLFEDLDAPEDFIVGVFDSPSAKDPLAIQLTSTVPGQAVPLPPFNLTPVP
jgi:5-hydroxyisourate hydrolase-like protein (transthyretin family)